MSAITPVSALPANGVTSGALQSTSRTMRLDAVTTLAGVDLRVIRMLPSGDWIIDKEINLNKDVRLSKSDVATFTFDVASVGEYYHVLSVGSAPPSDLICYLTNCVESATLTGISEGIPLTFPLLLSQLVSNQICARFLPGIAGRIKKMECVVINPVTTSLKLAQLQANISGTAISGGILSANSTGFFTQATRQAGTTVTGTNTFSATQQIEVMCNSVTAFVEGQILLQIYIQPAL